MKHFIHLSLKFFYPLVRKVLGFRVYCYLAVGAANTVLNIGLFMVFYWVFKNSNIAVELATLLSFLLTVLSGFWLSKNFAFAEAENGKKENQKQFGRYFLVALQGQFSDYLLTKGLIVFLLLNPSLAYVLSTIVMLVLNYFLQKYFTFRLKGTSESFDI